jgi:hypothetical protein
MHGPKNPNTGTEYCILVGILNSAFCILNTEFGILNAGVRVVNQELVAGLPCAQ